MNKYIVFSILLVCSFRLHAKSFSSSCKEFQTHNKQALKVTKTFNQANELIVRLGINKNTCEFHKGSNILRVYWEMGKDSYRGKIPCEKPLIKEVREFFGYNDLEDMYKRAIKEQTSHKVVISMPALTSFPERVGSKAMIGEDVVFKAFKVGSQCKLQAFILLNNRYEKLSRIHNIIKFFSLRKIELYQNDRLIKRLD